MCVPLRAVASTWLVRRRRVFAPAGDLLSCVDKKGGKEATPASSALALRGLPCAARSLRVGQNSLRAVPALRSNSRPKLDVDARCVRPAKPCAAQLVRRGRRTPAGLAARRHDGASLRSRCEARRGWNACEASDVLLLGPLGESSSSAGLCSSARQRASTTDFARWLRSAKRTLS